MVDEMTGSPCYETNGFEIQAGSNITIQNGTIRSDIAEVLVQNYSNLTLDNVTLDGTGTNNENMLSCNFGNTILKNGTKLISSGATNSCAMDVYYGMAAKYDSGVSVTIADDSVSISGPVEYAKSGRVDTEDFAQNAHLYIPADYTLAAPQGYTWRSTIDGRQELVSVESL